MWNCLGDERQLRPAEKRLFIASVSRMAGEIEEGQYSKKHTDSSIFGRMSDGEKTVALAYVCSYLTNELEPPRFHPWMESTISAVFDCVNDYVYEEIRTLSGTQAPREYDWRILVVSAFSGASDTDNVSKFFENDDYEIWYGMIQVVRNGIVDDVSFAYMMFCRITNTHVGPTSNKQLVRLAKMFLDSVRL